MLLDPGDYFVVVRGQLVNAEMETPFGTQPASYSDDFKGAVFEALVLEHHLCAAKFIFPQQLAGHTLSIHLNDGSELMTVTQPYIDALLSGVQFSKPASPPGIRQLPAQESPE